MLSLKIPHIKQLVLLILLCNLQFSSLFTVENERKLVLTVDKFFEEINAFKFKESLYFIEIEPNNNLLLAMTTDKYLNESEVNLIVNLINKIGSNTYTYS